MGVEYGVGGVSDAWCFVSLLACCLRSPTWGCSLPDHTLGGSARAADLGGRGVGLGFQAFEVLSAPEALADSRALAVPRHRALAHLTACTPVGGLLSHFRPVLTGLQVINARADLSGGVARGVWSADSTARPLILNTFSANTLSKLPMRGALVPSGVVFVHTPDLSSMSGVGAFLADRPAGFLPNGLLGKYETSRCLATDLESLLTQL